MEFGPPKADQITQAPLPLPLPPLQSGGGLGWGCNLRNLRNLWIVGVYPRFSENR